MRHHSSGSGYWMVGEFGVILCVVGVPARDVEPPALDLHRLIGSPATVEQECFFESGMASFRALALDDEAEVAERHSEGANVSATRRLLWHGQNGPNRWTATRR